MAGEFEVMKDYWQFCRKVGMLHMITDFEELELEIFTKGVIASFGKEDISELLTFCRSNPEFHIVTRLPNDAFVNGFLPNERMFFLANGERNNKIAYHWSGNINGPLDPAIVYELKRRLA